MRTSKYLVFFLVISLMLLVGVSYAAFIDSADVLGARFSVGSSDIKFLLSLDGGTDMSNLVDELVGPQFDNISPSWHQDYLIKIFNNSGSNVVLSSNANYETINDPDDLRQIIYVEPFVWDDVNNDGLATEDEIGPSFGRKTVVKWKTEGYEIGQLSSGELSGLVLRFSTDGVSDTKQGASATFDFVFDALGL